MGLAERADLIVDFTNVPVGQPRARATSDPTSRSAAACPATTSTSPIPDTTGQIMQFRVVPAVAADDSTPPQFLAAPGDHAAAGGDGHPAAGAARGDVGVLRRRPRRGPARHRRRRPRTSPPACGPSDCGWTRSPRTRPSAPPRSGSSTTPPPTPTRCTSTRSPSRSSTAQDIVVDEEASEVQVVPGSVPTPPGAVGDRLQGHRHRLPGPGHPGQSPVQRRPASSSGTATSSSTRTTR